MPETSAPAALLFTAPGCPHCPGVKASLEKLLAEGAIGSLEVVDVTLEQARAAELGVRSVPWLRLGDFVLTGAQTPQELRQWAERAAHPQGMSGYLEHLLANGELAEAESLLQKEPDYIKALLPLLAAGDTPIQVRLGIGAILESLEGQEALRSLLPELIRLSAHEDHRVRSDACHYLGLSHSAEALPALEVRLVDVHPEVREIAAEAIETIGENQ
jgi:thiol-disulfide isomerase/thioredoxin